MFHFGPSLEDIDGVKARAGQTLRAQINMIYKVPDLQRSYHRNLTQESKSIQVLKSRNFLKDVN